MRTWKRKEPSRLVFLQLTSMVDMFTIILVFLLLNYSTSAVQISPADRLQLPVSSTGSEPVEGLKMTVSARGVLVEGEPVLDWPPHKKDRLLKPLLQRLNMEAKKTRDIAEANQTVQFDGKAVVQVDKSVPYSWLKKVMYTSTLAGYSDFRLVVMDAQ